MTEEDNERCYLYWIHKPEHANIFNEGYVGVSGNPQYRFYQHFRNAVNPKEYKNYRTEFRKAMEDDKVIYDILLCSTSEYCYEIEGKLRPTWRIGWNLAAGGAGGFGTHGLTGTKVKRDYYNMLTRAKDFNEEVCDDWLGDNGLLNFKKFCDDLEDVDGELTLKIIGEGYSPSNVIKATREYITNRSRQIYDIGDGSLYSVRDLASKFSLKPNTISSRTRNGWTIREAVGLDARMINNRLVLPKSKDTVTYQGSFFSADSFEQMRLLYEQGKTITEIANTLNTQSSSISRYCRKFNFSIEGRKKVFVDFLGESFTLNLRTDLTEDLVEAFKALVIQRESASSIAEKLGIKQSKVYRLKEMLRWSDYERTLE